MKKYLKETIKYLLRSYPFIAPYVKEIETLYNLSEKELYRRNEKVFLKIFQKAYTKSPFYHQLYNQAKIGLKDIQSLKDIKKLPVITKEMIKANPESLLTVPSWKVIQAHTSGSTGTPLTVYESYKAVLREQAYFYCYRKRCGFSYGQPLASLRGNLGKQETTLWIPASHTLYLSGYNLRKEVIDEYYQTIQDKKPLAIEGYPSSLYNLCLLLKEKNYLCQIPLCFTSSETLHSYQRELIEIQLKTQIYDHYGNTERTIRLSESLEHTGYFEDPGYSINEYLEDGIITTSLINSSFPLIRYKVTDKMKINNDPSLLTMGSIPIKVKKIEGRIGDYIVGKDGSKYSESALTFIFKSSHHIKMSQIIQTVPGKINVHILPETQFNESDKNILIKAFNEKVGKNNMDIEIKIISENEIEYTRRNKLSLVINKINLSQR